MLAIAMNFFFSLNYIGYYIICHLNPEEGGSSELQIRGGGIIHVLLNLYIILLRLTTKTLYLDIRTDSSAVCYVRTGGTMLGCTSFSQILTFLGKKIRASDLLEETGFHNRR